MWGDDERGEAEEAVASNHSVVFSLAPPSDALEDARRVVRDLIATAERGRRRRRRLAAGAPATEPDAVGTQPRDGSPPEEEEGGRRRGWQPRQLSIEEACSLTQRGGGDRPRAASRAAWSRVLARGLESDEEDAGGPMSCAARLLAAGRALAAPSSSLPSSYEISLFAPAPPPPSSPVAAAADRDDRDATADAASPPPPPPVSPECLASVVAGLAVHPAVGSAWASSRRRRGSTTPGPSGSCRARPRRTTARPAARGGGNGALSSKRASTAAARSSAWPTPAWTSTTATSATCGAAGTSSLAGTTPAGRWCATPCRRAAATAATRAAVTVSMSVGCPRLCFGEAKSSV